MSALWTADAAAQATGGLASGDWTARGISIDTRTLQPGDLFVALKDQRDGHEFVAQALADGAAAALVSHRPDGVAKDAPLLMVADVLTALEALARAARARCKAQVIAVTGSVGKTSVKDMLHTALSRQGRVHAAERSFNNHWGVPLTLARMPENCDFAVIEIGMNHPGEITPLSRLTRPHVAIITTVAEAHLAAFDGVEQIAFAKAEIFAGLEPGGTAILNRDIPTFEILQDAAVRAGASLVTFGENKQADFRLLELKTFNTVSTIKARINSELALFKIGASGRHAAQNALAVLAAVKAANADPVVAALDLATWHPPAGRGARGFVCLDTVEQELRIELIDDAYNANPASMAAAFEVLAATTPLNGIGRIKRGRRLAFLTDMLELGDAAATAHRDLAGLPALANVDLIHSAGPLMKHLHEALPPAKRGEWHDSAEKLAHRVHHLLDAGDVVMVKGSKGSKASQVVDAIRKLGQAARS